MFFHEVVSRTCYMAKHHHTGGARKCKAVGTVGKEGEPNARRTRGIFGAGMAEPKEEKQTITPF